MYVEKNTVSQNPSVSNWVRQGGIMSSYFVCVYMDGLSK